MFEDCYRAAGKAALRKQLGPLHEQDDVIVADDFVDPVS
jgi:hypothetical protein